MSLKCIILSQMLCYVLCLLNNGPYNTHRGSRVEKVVSNEVAGNKKAGKGKDRNNEVQETQTNQRSIKEEQRFKYTRSSEQIK